MSGLSYIKGVRTRFRNTLVTEIDKAKSIIDDDDVELEIHFRLSRVSKCLEKVKIYKEKLEIQSEKYASALEEDDEEIEKIIDEDCALCLKAEDVCIDLETLDKRLRVEKDRTESRDSESDMEKLVEIQKDMQSILASQLKQQELSFKKETEKLSAVKLPKIDLIMFNGDKTKWIEFWDSYESAVHKNKSLSNVEKFNYLKSKLVGEARSAIAGLAMSADNYQVALDILKKRFGNTQDIISMHYRQLINQTSATNNVTSLRHFIDSVDKHTRSLEVLNQEINQDIVVSIIKSKLPEDVIVQLEIQKDDDTNWTVNTLSEQLQKYIKAREIAAKDTGKSDRSRTTPTFLPKRQNTFRKSTYWNPNGATQMSSTQTLSTTDTYENRGVAKKSPRRTNQGNVVPEKKCRYCESGHYSDECTKYKTINERKHRIKGSCYKCLRHGHMSKDCKSRRACVYCQETNAHHRSLCPKRFSDPTVTHISTERNESDTSEKEQETGCMTMSEMVLMQTALTEVKHPETNDAVKTRILLDTGSQRSYISQKLAHKLNLEVNGEQDIHVVTFGSQNVKTIKTKYTNIDVKLKNGKYINMTMNIVPVISGELHRKPISDLESDKVSDMISSVQLADIVPRENETSPIECLIGNDYYLDIVNGDKIELQEGLYLLSSKLGWILSGRTNVTSENESETNMLVLTLGSEINKTNTFSTMDSSLPPTTELEDFWKIESIGITDKQTKTEDTLAMEQFAENLKFEEKRYQVTWPWKCEQPDLPTNRDLSLGRLRSSVNRMKNKPDIMEKYNDVIQDQLKKGVIEKVNTKEPDGIVHYLPHHGVVTPHKETTKLRLVYDASAKTRKENQSLNDCLYRGPVMIHDLCGILIRFRMYSVAIVSDIEKAFLQIGLQRDQRDVTRFLWLKDTTNPSIESSNIEEYRFCRVPFGVVSSPFLLGATIENHLDTYNNEVSNKIKANIYVDNLITGTNNVSEAKSLYNEAKDIFNAASMNLREWVSNNEEVNAFFSQKDKSEVDTMKVLGHEWDVKRDTLSFKYTANCNENQHMTKRLVLKRVASIFDPLGLISPVILGVKVFLQELWGKNVSWDEPLSDADQGKWLNLEEQLNDINLCCVPRSIAIQSEKLVEYRLLCFCDASKKAYAVVIYLHQKSEEKTQTKLVFTKTRLAPVKTLSIPRLELLAVVIGLRCLKFVQKQVHQPITQLYAWTDSQCVLHWINSEKQLSVFVKNRVNEIKESKDVLLSYVPTKENPADIASRGARANELMRNELWWKGPKWLDNPENEWPKSEVQLNEETKRKYESEVCQTKAKKETCFVQITHNNRNKEIHQSYSLESPMGIKSSDFSSVTKLLRVTALALRFVKKLQKRSAKTGYLTSAEIKESELLWLRYIQKSNFADITESVTTGKKNTTQQQLGVYIDTSGILRCKGRLENASVSESARFPILLPKYDWYTRLVIDKTHREILHSGVSQTLSTVRSRYWIPHGRAVVKSVLKSCMVCRRYEGGPYKMPPMCSLPESRVTEGVPFSRIGLDYMGPIFTKNNYGDKKVWICIFTCLITRAIHLELVYDMSTTEFLMCFRRFIAQRGTPVMIISDNASQFRAANTVLDRIWNQIHKNDDVMSYVSNSGITWYFNVELSPWMGGFYERLIGLVKRSMRKTIGRRLLTVNQLQTLVKEIESVLNSRPLVYVGDDINSSIPLTPANFLTNNPKIGIPETEINTDSDYLPVESTADKLIKLWKNGQRILDMFWKVWKHEYLLSLRERTQTVLKTGRIQSNYQPKAGDVVLIKDDTSRGNWKFGKVTKLIGSRDNKIRSAKVLTPAGNEIGRPINLIYPLEVSERESQFNNSSEQSDVKVTQEENEYKKNSKSPRSQRHAAIKANKAIKQSLKN